MAPRDSATVMLLRPVPSGPGFEVYMLRRKQSMAFAAGAYVYPGGSVDSRDAEAGIGWAGPGVPQWAAWLGAGAEQAQGLVCAAVRETFEESGVLLAGAPPGEATVPPDAGGTVGEPEARAGGESFNGAAVAPDATVPPEGAGPPENAGAPEDTGAPRGAVPRGAVPLGNAVPQGAVPPEADLERGRLALLDQSLSLAGLLAQHHLVLRSDLLKPWARWITPDIERRRYDARFFVAVLPDGQRTREIRDEADEVAWLRPADVLDMAARGDAALMPPTAVTLAELADCGDIAAVLATERQVVPLQPQVTVEDGVAWLHMPAGVEYPL